MKNDNLLFEYNGILNNNKLNLSNKKYIYVNNKFRFDGKSIDNIIKFVNKVEQKNSRNKIPILFKLGKIEIADKLTFIIFECICNYLIKNNRRVYVEFETERNIYTEGIASSPLLLLDVRNKQSSEKYLKTFKSEIFGSKYRRVVTVEENNDPYLLSKIMTDLDSFLKVFSVIKQYRDAITEVIVELVGNALEHAQTDCLIDLDVTEEYKKEEADGEYYGINITIVNFSEKVLGYSISEKVRHPDLLNERHSHLNKAYDMHKNFFNEDYTETDFYHIATFQHKISGRMNIESTGGIGLTSLIKGLEDYSDAYHCYVITDNRALFFLHDYLNFNEENWIGFNKENDFLNCIPADDVVRPNGIKMPGTAYNLNFVMKIGE